MILIKRYVDDRIVDTNLQISQDKNIALENFSKVDGEYRYFYKGIKVNKTYSDEFISFIHNQYNKKNNIAYKQFMPYFQSIINVSDWKEAGLNTKDEIVQISNRIVLNYFNKKDKDVAVWLSLTQGEWDNYDNAVELINKYQTNKIERAYHNAKRYNDKINRFKFEQAYYEEHKSCHMNSKSKFLGNIIRSYHNNHYSKLSRLLTPTDLYDTITSRLTKRELKVRKKVYLKETEFKMLKEIGNGLNNVEISRILINLWSNYYTITNGRPIECLITKNTFETSEELLDLRWWYPIYYEEMIVE